MTRVRNVALIAAGGSLLLCSAASAQWLKLVNKSSTRLQANPALVVNDNLEKDFGIADLDNDGDTDLIMVRKFWGSQTGGFTNVLFMNEGGILVDRTVEYASTSDVAGYNGFLDLTNDRDVKVFDFNNDGWLDFVVTTTMSDGVIDVLGQPRAYVNLGNDGDGNWLGFLHERNRIPHIFPPNGHATANPRFCDCAVGDYNGDGYKDIFFVDYDTAETVGQTTTKDLNNDGDTNDPGESQTSPSETGSGIYSDFNNKLLINAGASNPGFFSDSTNTILTNAQLASAFGNTCFGADMNGDGKDDIVRIHTLTSGQNISIFTKNATGSLFTTSTPYFNAPYFVEPGDLNGDGKLDMVVSDDQKDKYMINTGNAANGTPNFTTYTISEAPSQFDHTIRIADWDNDGKPDAFITDIDADVGNFCPTGRFSHFYRNIFNGANTNALFSMAQGDAAIPQAERSSWFDLAPIDIDGDGWLDLVAGRCAGVIVYMNRNAGIDFTYPSGKPTIVDTAGPTVVPISLAVLGSGSVVGGSVMLNYRLTSADGDDFTQVAAAHTGGNNYEVTLPAAVCGQEIEWYVEASLTNGGPYKEPAEAPGLLNSTPVGSASVNVFSSSFETGNEGWTVVDTGMGVGQKGFEVATPVATTNTGKACSPGTAAQGTKIMTTWVGTAGGAASATDLDAGTTKATSPVFDLSAVQSPSISYSRWLYCDDALNATQADTLLVEISNNGGGSWTTVENVNWQQNAWATKSFMVSDLLTPTNNMQLRFTISDSPDNSITEAAFDNIVVTGVTCVVETPCPSDANDDGVVDGGDITVVLGAWGTNDDAADINDDGTVDGADITAILGGWGACP